MRPRLYLDVDGVINLHPAKELEELTGLEELPTKSPYGPVRLPTNVRKNLARLDKVFEIVWATAWRSDAVELGVVLGIGEKRWLQWDDLKLRAIAEQEATTQGKWAFLDDDAEWEKTETGIDPGENLVLQAVTNTGLTNEITRQLIAWAKQK